jgi:RNA polymerase sigma-70 factor (ECF subfamily)
MNREGNRETHQTVEAVALRSRSKLVAFLAARFGDLAAAEDAVSEAIAAALLTWPQTGCPANPEAWLLTAARRKRIDQLRGCRETAGSDALETLAGAETAAEDHDLSNELPDRRLALLFACTHPAIDPAIRAPLMLQVVLGLEASQIGSAFLISPAAMAQRLVRAKTKIRDAGIPFSIPDRSELPDRVEAVLDSVYACFSEGWLVPEASDASHRDLAGEAIFLGRLLVELLPDDPEASGLLALMLYSESRRRARRTAGGKFVPLARQDITLWDTAMIQEAEVALRHASRAGRIGRYQLEAAIQSAHLESVRSGNPPWLEIAHLYDALVHLTGSPVASINRAIAIAEINGAAAGLAVLETVSKDPRIESYQPYWAVRANLLARTRSPAAARHAYQMAIGLESDPAVREYLQEQSETLPE